MIGRVQAREVKRKQEKEVSLLCHARVSLRFSIQSLTDSRHS